MFKFLYRIKHLIGKSTPNNGFERNLQSGLRQFQTVDPETKIQWKRLKNTLESNHNIVYSQPKLALRIFSKPAFSFGVAALVLIIVGMIWLRYSSVRIYETAKGQHSNILLQDSTEIVLNYMSELRVDRWPLEKTRRVALKGEALFHVRKDGTPFILTTDVGTIQVLGTKFNVRVRDDKMEVAVLEGSVKVSMNKNGKDSSIILGKDQIAICEKNSFPDVPKSNPFIGYPGWIQGKFMFYRTGFISACKELELQFDVIIRIKNTRQQNTSITGVVNGQSIEGALTTITQLTGSKYRYEGGGYIIY